jgi:predicted dinucleotide-binding enzyme
MKIAFIGIGNVGFALANNFEKKGHIISIASDNSTSDSVKKALTQNPNFNVLSKQQAIDEAEIIFLATPFQAIEEALKGLSFNGKTLVDCTNPVGAGISHSLKSEKSGSEIIQSLAADAKVVKAFTIYGYENLIHSDFPNYNSKPAMLIAGDSIVAKKLVTTLCNDINFDAIDTGRIDQALHLEHMTLLWVKMVRRDGHHPNFVWSYLENNPQ